MLRRTHRLPVLALVTALALLAACGKSVTKAAPTTTLPKGPPVVKIGTTRLGEVLVDATGRTLYVDDEDPVGSQPTCLTGLCAVQFPAMLVAKKVFPVGPGLEPSRFKTTNGLNFTLIATFYGRALHRCRTDALPGQVRCQNSGDVWHAIGPDGLAILPK